MSLRTHVIVLCQGRQQRLSGIRTPKQLLTLPAHEASGAPNTTILTRTLMQVFRYLGGIGINVDAGPGVDRYNEHRVTVVGWPEMYTYFHHHHVRIPHLRAGDDTYIDYVMTPDVTTLAEPGNSSLKGISHYLHEVTQPPREVKLYDGTTVMMPSLRNEEWPDRTVVLLGDVVYSWACLRAIFRGGTPSPTLAFVGTPRLTAEDGEMWGVMWTRATDKVAMVGLENALKRHSNDDSDEYQPGQLRHWLWAIDQFYNYGGARDHFVPIEDYTMDVDLPEHLVTLADSSLQAAADDREQGMVW